MALRYDFDIFSVIPAEVMNNPKIGAMLKNVGVDSSAAGNSVALFRDPATVEALKTSPESVKALFKASGFGESVSPYPVPWGHYRESDEDARVDLISRLTDNLKTYPLPSADEMAQGGFNFGSFLQALTTSMPIPDSEVPDAPAPTPPQPAAPAPAERNWNQHVPMPGMPKDDKTEVPPELDPRIPPPPTEPEEILKPTGKLSEPPPSMSRADFEQRRKKSIAALVVLAGIGLIAFAVFQLQ